MCQECKIMCIFAVVLWQTPITDGGGVFGREHDITKRRLLNALFLTYQESSKFNIKVKNEATVDARCGICRM